MNTSRHESIALELDPAPWQAIADGVMGGLSTGNMQQADDGSLRFAGEISLANNGGFASARRALDTDLTGLRALLLEVRGDGRRYQCRLREDDDSNSAAWSASFSTGDDWQTVQLPLSAFKPVFRGRPVAGAGPLDPAKIRLLGLMLADRLEGPFRLDIRSIVFDLA